MDTNDSWTATARELWLWPVAILLGFPLGGLISNLVVDGVDSVGAAIAAGLVAGAIAGTAQWLALRRWVSWLWIAATSVGMAVGLMLGAALVNYGTDRGDLVLMGAVTGAGIGALQAVVLARHGVAGAWWWAVVNPPGWALGWLITSYVISGNAADQWANFGAGGALVFGLLTWAVLAQLFRSVAPEAREAATAAGP